MSFRRFFKFRFLKRLVGWSLLLGLAGAALGTAVFVVAASRAQAGFRPVLEPVSAEHAAVIGGIAGYRRAEEATYLTFPEWYLVFNPQEYAQFLRIHRPSGFAYGRSIAQFWHGYVQVYAIARRHYPFNFGNHLMVVVIGTSSTVEYAIKGGYENTVGRLFEWTAVGHRTPEEDYAADVAREYGDFVPTRPWFDFPFGKKFAGLWSSTDFFGPQFLRKCERKFFLSLEYGVKFLYAGVIRLASHSVYGVADTEIYATVTDVPEAAFTNPVVKKVRPAGNGAWIVTLPHYQGFTDTLPGLARQGVQFIEVAGNDEILATLIAPAAWTYDLADGRALFTMELLSGPEFKRVAVQVPVKSLGRVLREMDAKGLRLEHLFDY